jgi:hypothetical protein
METGETEIAPVGQTSGNICSSTVSLLITGLPRNIPGISVEVTSGINCFPW